MPTTFLLPKDTSAAREAMSKNDKFWIYKPSFDKCGDGILLCKKFEDIGENVLSQEAVLQEYINNPLLISGKKFSIREYLHMFGYQPMITYSTDVCYANSCAHAYVPVNEDNFDDNSMHLSNQVVNETDPNYVRAFGDSIKSDITGEGTNQLRYDTMFKVLAKEHGFKQEVLDKLKDDIQNVMLNLIQALYPSMLHSAEQQLGDLSFYKNKLFLSIGVDIMVDDELKPWIVEINWDAGLTYGPDLTDAINGDFKQPYTYIGYHNLRDVAKLA